MTSCVCMLSTVTKLMPDSHTAKSFSTNPVEALTSRPVKATGAGG